MADAARTLVAGVDLGTQSTKVVVCDAATGEVLREGRRANPDGTEVDPARWWVAFKEATAGGLLDGVSAIGVAGQQHGLVPLDDSGSVVRPALLWNDVRSADAAADLVAELGGRSAWVEAVGSVPVAAFTVTKLRWLAEHEPQNAERVTHAVLPHDWLTALLVGGGRLDPAGVCTDRGDASGTGYWSPASGSYRSDLLRMAFGRHVGTPRVLPPDSLAGHAPDGVLVSVGTGDNMAAGLGLGLAPGDVVVSLGTSGTAFGPHHSPSADDTGAVASFADATGGFLPLVCTLNAARVLTSTAQMLGTDLAGLDGLALQAPAGAGGLVLLPYFDGERTPDLPTATGAVSGLTRENTSPAHMARAAVEGMLCGLADGVDALRRQGVEVRRLLLIGGAARSRAVQAAAADLLGAPISVPAPAEYVALGAAKQAAWALRVQHGDTQMPEWARPAETIREPVDPQTGAVIRQAYAQLRASLYPQSGSA